MNHAPLDVRDALAERQGAIGEIRALPVAGLVAPDCCLLLLAPDCAAGVDRLGAEAGKFNEVRP